MRLICPGCGAVCSAEAWSNDAEARQALKIVAELPESVSRRALPYLALFRPMTGRALKWQAALRHLAELEQLARDPYVQWEGRPARPNDTRFWGQGMDRICEQPPKKLPLKSHGYLRVIVYEIADDADRKTETVRNQAEASGRTEIRSHRGPDRISYEEMVELRERKKVEIGRVKGESGKGRRDERD